MDRKAFLASVLAAPLAMVRRDPADECERAAEAAVVSMSNTAEMYRRLDEADHETARIEALRRAQPIRLTCIIETDGVEIHRVTRELKDRSK